MSTVERPGDRFALMSVGDFVIAVETALLEEIRAAAGEEFDLDLAELLGVGDLPAAERKLVRLCHRSRAVLLAVPGSLEVGRSLPGACHRPSLIAAALDRTCLRGVVRDGNQLIYLLDVGRVASRLDRAGRDGG